jgi:ADP-heptose:LPS heptosyltransferase
VSVIVKRELKFPAIVLPNLHFMGDNVLLEPIARCMAIQGRSYILSQFAELFEGHPTVVGINDPNQIPEGSKIVDINEAISNTERQPGGDYLVLGDKNLSMWQAAGFSRVIDYPRLYLTANEWAEVKHMKRWFQRPCIGVVLRTRHTAKNWAYMMMFIRSLILNKEFDVFIFAKGVSKKTLAATPPGVHYFLNRPIREVMQGLSMMDVVITPDTGLGHISAALGIETVVVCFKLFADLYEMYPTATVIANDKFSMAKGITGISVREMLMEVDQHLLSNRDPIPVANPPVEVETAQRLLFVRFRGLGDVLLSLPALATFKKMNPNTEITYLTSPGVADLVRLSGVVDEVLEMSYRHPASGLPLPPKGIDYEPYDTVINAINAIDFGSETADVHRTRLFAELLGLDQVDYSTDWQFQIPLPWIADARSIVEQHGVSSDRRIIVLQADSKGLSRIWQMGRQKEFVGLAKKRGVVVAVSDEEHRYPASVVNLTGKLTFRQYVGMIGLSDILISPDSGGLHIAGCSNNKALGLFGSVLPELRISHYPTVNALQGKAKCVPCNDWQQHSCRGEKNSPMCLWSLKADKVLKAAMDMLKEDES